MSTAPRSGRPPRAQMGWYWSLGAAFGLATGSLGDGLLAAAIRLAAAVVVLLVAIRSAKGIWA